MTFRCCLPLFSLALGLHAAAQEDQPIKMTPDFALTFPVTLMNQHDVSVKYPILINPITVLQPGMVLRVIYMPPVQSESENLVLAHKGNMEQSYSRDVGTGEEKEMMPREMAHEIETERRRVWQVPNNFVLAIAQYPTDEMHLIYATANKDKGLMAQKENLEDTSFSFFDGLFVGSPDGKVRVLAVETGSKGDDAGIKAGDEIVAVGSTPMTGDLHVFASAYAHAKDKAKDDETTTYPMTVRSENAAPRVVPIAMPLTLKSDLMQGFK